MRQQVTVLHFILICSAALIALSPLGLAQDSSNVIVDVGPPTEEATSKSWDLPRPGTRAGAPGFDSKGNVWFDVSGKIGHLDLQTGVITEYDVPGPDQPTVCRVHDDIVWCSSLRGRTEPPPTGYFTVGLGSEAMRTPRRSTLTGRALIRFDPKDKSFRIYQVGTPNSGPNRGDFDSEGNFWFGQIIKNKFGKLNPRTGEIVEYSIPSWKIPEAPGNKQTGTTYPYGLVVDKFDKVWVALNRGYKVVRFDPSTETFIEYVPPTPRNAARNVAADQSGNIWVTLSYKRKLAKIDAQSGLITEYEVPGLNAFPYHIRVAANGDIVFWDMVYSLLTVFSPTTGKFSSYKPDWAKYQIVSRHLRVNDQGQVFFSDENHSKIGMIQLPNFIPEVSSAGGSKRAANE